MKEQVQRSLEQFCNLEPNECGTNDELKSGAEAKWERIAESQRDPVRWAGPKLEVVCMS